LGSWIRNTIRNTGEGWKEVGGNRKGDKQGKEEQWRPFERKTKKLDRKGQNDKV